jgi:tetratricopeptide (TPR) repeat protein
MKMKIYYLIIAIFTLLLVGCQKSSYDYYKEGVEHLSKGNFDEARKSFKSSIEKDKNNYNSLYQLGKIFYKDSILDLATDYFLSANKLNPSDTSCIMYLSKCYYNQDKYDSAIYYLQQFQSRFPQNEKCIYLLSVSYLNSDSNLIASQLADILLKMRPNEASYNLVKGIASFSLNRYDLSKYYFLRTIELDSILPHSYFYLSLSYNYLNLPDSALIYAKKSFEQLKDYRSKVLIGSLYLVRLNNLNESFNEFDRLIDMVKSDNNLDNESDDENDNYQ